MQISLFEQADRNKVLHIHQATYGEMNLERFLFKVCQQIESLEMDCVRLVCKDERVKGYAAIYPVEENSFRLNLLVDPCFTQQGIGTILLNKIEIQARKIKAKQLEARIIEGMNESFDFALSHGFVELHRMRGVSLHAKDFSFEKWKALGEKLSATGFMATTFEAEEFAGENTLEKLIDLQKAAVQGWFQTGLSAPDVSDANLRNYFSCITVPDRVSIMKHGEKYVAYTSAERRNILGTAVHPEYRGRGIATFLKALNLRKLIEGGTKYFESSSANPAMLKVNEKLGFNLNGLAEIRLAKHL